MFEIKKLFVSARSATLELSDGGLYNTRKPYRVIVNGEEHGTAETVVHSIYGLWPDTKYTLKVFDGSKEVGRASIHQGGILHAQRPPLRRGGRRRA